MGRQVRRVPPGGMGLLAAQDQRGVGRQVRRALLAERERLVQQAASVRQVPRGRRVEPKRQEEPVQRALQVQPVLGLSRPIGLMVEIQDYGYSRTGLASFEIGAGQPFPYTNVAQVSGRITFIGVAWLTLAMQGPISFHMVTCVIVLCKIHSAVLLLQCHFGVGQNNPRLVWHLKHLLYQLTWK